VRNDGIKKTHYKVSLDGVSWVSVSPETLELNSGQTGNLNLIVNPGTGVEPGTYGVKINLDSNGAVYSKNVDLVLRKESEFMKKLKENVKFYQYYIYLLIVIVILIIIFRKPIIRIKNKTQKNYEKYKVKQEKLRALKISRKEKEEERKKEEEKKKKKELEEKEKARKKETEKKESKKKIKILKKISINKLWYYVLLFVVAVIFIGHNARLFNAKYLHIYIKNIFIGYLYYILIGVGTIVVLFLLVLFYNYLGKKGKMPKNQRFLAPTTLEKKKVKKVVKKAEKKTKKGTEWYNKPSYVIAIFLPIIILLAALAYLNLFDDIRDFFVLYQYYFVLGILILIVIILLIRFYKPLFEFLKE
jgi:3D (Asp-Asp-Asp) domain-containing protein